MALELAIIGVVAGAVLGLRYNALVLVPAILSAMLFSVIVGVLRGEGTWSIVLLTLLLTVAVQLGYLAGITIYAVVESICKGLSKDRNPLSSLGSAWPQTWQAPSWQLTPSTVSRLHPPQPPQA